MKVVIYYEGYSERKMFNSIFHRSTQPMNITEDYMDLLTAPENAHTVLLYECHGSQNVFPYVADTRYLYSQNQILIIVRDLEKSPCFTHLKGELENTIPDLPQNRTRLLFSQPVFEEVYFADLLLFERVFRILYRKHSDSPIPDIQEFRDKISKLDHSHPQSSIKSLFRAYGMAFNKPLLAKEFFARFDFHKSNHPYVSRVMNAVHELV